MDASQVVMMGQVERLMELGLVMLHTLNVIAMAAGFALLESGSVHKKHCKSILMKNLLDGAVTALLWYVCGYAVYTMDLADCATKNGETAVSLLALYGFAATCTTIVSGSVVARIHLHIYLIVVAFLVMIVFPVCARMVWHEDGLLHGWFLDYAGGAAVHGAAGLFGLIGAYLCGPRVGRFIDVDATSDADDDDLDMVMKPRRVAKGVKEMPASSPGMQVLGGFILFFGWISFNTMSGSLAGTEALLQGYIVALNTLLGSTAGVLVGATTLRYRTGYYDLADTVNCLLAGLCSVTAGAGFIDPWAALVIGAMGAPFFLGMRDFILYRLRIDDPLGASALHGCVGLFGCLMIGIFHIEDGLVYGGGLGLLGRQVAGTALIGSIGLTGGILCFGVCYKLGGNSISVSREVQIVGIDFELHDGYDVTDVDKNKVAEFNQYKKALASLQLQKARTSGSSFESDVARPAKSFRWRLNSGWTSSSSNNNSSHIRVSNKKIAPIPPVINEQQQEKASETKI